MQEEMAGLQQEVDALLKRAQEAEAGDASESASLHEQLQDKRVRQEKLAGAKRELEQRIQAEDAEIKRRAQGEGAEKPPTPSEKPDGRKRSRPPSKKTQGKLEQKVINLADSESRLMSNPQGGFRQAYNVQAVVETSGHQLILGVRLTNEGNDRRALGETLRSVPTAFRSEIQTALADTGYDNATEIAQVEQEQQITVLCPPQSKGAPKAGSTYRLHRQKQKRIQFAAEMRQRLASEENQKLYRRRFATIEPVFGVLKNVLGFTRFRLFGLAKSGIELLLLSTAYNLRKLAQLHAAAVIA
jgi:hypothetical protein